jgi:hypothetical protein
MKLCAISRYHLTSPKIRISFKHTFIGVETR